MTNIFDNAESVTIDNVEVQSIKDTDGGVIFEKAESATVTLSITGDTFPLPPDQSIPCSGTASPHASDYSVMIYANGSHISDTSVSQNDTYSLTLKTLYPAGQYTVVAKLMKGNVDPVCVAESDPVTITITS